MTKVPILKADGTKKGDITLPSAFNEAIRPDVIHKAVRVAQSNRRQPYGSGLMSGAMHSTKSAGKGKGMSRVPRIQGSGPGALAPPTVGGRRAHPPEARRVWTEKINHKENRLAIRSGLAATALSAMVQARGHKIDAKHSLPIVVDDAFEKMDKTADMLAAFDKLGLMADLTRAIEGKHVRPGIGKLRGRRYKSPTSVLIVAANTDKIRKGAGNLPGVDIIAPRQLNAEYLAPGGIAGRLTVFTESALKAMEEF
jgi:large subunit ribosomal protein L4e